MKNKNYGCKVELKLCGRFKDSKNPNEILRNVTEIHYLYPSADGKKIAFESDIHGTGVTHYIEDIAEFETTLETKKEDAF